MRARYCFDAVQLPPLNLSNYFEKEQTLERVEQEMLSRFSQFPHRIHPVFQVFLSSLREFIKNSYDAGADQMWFEVEVHHGAENNHIQINIKDNGSKAAEPVPHFLYDPWKNLLKTSDKEGKEGYLGGNCYGLVFAAYELDRYCGGGQLALAVTPGEGATITLSGPLVNAGMHFTQDVANEVLNQGLSEMAIFLMDKKREQIFGERTAGFNQRCEELKSRVSSEGRPAGFTLRFLVETRRNAFAKQQEVDLRQFERECQILSTRLKSRPSVAGSAGITKEGLLCSDDGEPVQFQAPCRRKSSLSPVPPFDAQTGAVINGEGDSSPFLVL